LISSHDGPEVDEMLYQYLKVVAAIIELLETILALLGKG
jgi:hypothetical protein